MSVVPNEEVHAYTGKDIDPLPQVVRYCEFVAKFLRTDALAHIAYTIRWDVDLQAF